ncbi:hypothetical protein BH11BAC3_BH11BAC3_42210 [soil metagenome]
MIQRVQSVWLLIASILAFLCLKLSFYSGTHLPDNLYHQVTATDSILLMVTSIALGMLTLITIFLYKTRIVQLRLTILAIVLDLLLVYLFYRQTTSYTQGAYSITAATHVIIVVMLFMAARGINKDEKLIKDSDRLR